MELQWYSHMDTGYRHLNQQSLFNVLLDQLYIYGLPPITNQLSVSLLYTSIMYPLVVITALLY